MPKTKYIWDDENILMEKDASGVTQKTYTLEPQLYGNLVSEYDGTDTRPGPARTLRKPGNLVKVAPGRVCW